MFSSRNTFIGFILTSCLLHLALIYFNIETKFSTKELSAPIKMVEVKLVSESNTTKTLKENKVYSQASQSKISLKNLMPKNTFSISRKELNAKSKPSGEQDFLEIENLSFFHKVWDKINEQYYYPGIFNVNQISGSARVKIRVNKNGTLDSGFLNVESGSDHIKSFIRKTVIKSLLKPLHKKFWHKKSDVAYLTLEFKLDLLHTVGTESDQEQSIKKDYFYFYRKTFNPYAHPMKKAIPILGPPMIDLVATYNLISGRDKKLKKQWKVDLNKFKAENDKWYKAL